MVGYPEDAGAPELSIVAMAVRAAGYLPPVAGHSSKRALTLAVIVNALTALRG